MRHRVATLAAILLTPGLADAQGAARPAGNPATVGVVAPRPAAPAGHEPRVRPGRSITGGRAAAGAPPNVVHRPNVGGPVAVLPCPYERLRHRGRIFFHCHGVFYVTRHGRYEVSESPVGATVRGLPDGTETLEVDGRTIYYFDGVFYSAGRRRGEYVVIEAPIGAVVGHLPSDAEEVVIAGRAYLVARGVAYLEVTRDGERWFVVSRP